MNISVAVLAAVGCSLCNGISTVQQKIGADREHAVRKFDLSLLVRLLKDAPYIFGIALAIGGYCLSLVALRVLPLFLVQSVIAASVIVTAFGEQSFSHRKIDRQTYIALGAVITGLILLAISAVSSRATGGDHTARLIIEWLPLPVGILGVFFIYVYKRFSAMALAALGGLAFGNTSTIGRIMVYPHTLWKLAENPLIYSLVLSAILGQYLFTVALQRSTATKSNAVMISLQTFGPAICGLLLFDDKIRSGFQLLVLLGSLLVIVGAATTVVDESPAATI